MEERLWTVSEVAKRLRLDETTVRRYIADGAMEAVILPHKGKRKVYRIKQSTLNKIVPPQGGTTTP
jgi:excisionase family DNA binding protein